MKKMTRRDILRQLAGISVLGAVATGVRAAISPDDYPRIGAFTAPPTTTTTRAHRSSTTTSRVAAPTTSTEHVHHAAATTAAPVDRTGPAAETHRPATATP